MSLKGSPIKFLLVFLVLGWSSCALAQEAQPSDSLNQNGLGPSSVSGQLASDGEKTGAFLSTYFDFKKSLSEKHGFSYGIDYYSNYQVATAGLEDLDTDAFSGVFRVYGNWNLVGRQSGNTGSFIFKVESRHAYSSFIPGQSLASNLGYVGLNSITFSNTGWILSNLYWQQSLLDNRLAFVAGIVDATDYTNVYGLVDPWNDFYNLTFSTGAHVAVPDQGLGFALRGMITDNVYALLGISDINGDPSDPGKVFDSFFSTAEYFSQIEVGWISSLDQRFTDNIHLLFWHADERQLAQVNSGWGLAFSFTKTYNQWEPFFRAGYTDGGGTLLETSIDIGSAYSFKNKTKLGFGLSWGVPNADTFGEGLDNQFTIESYYRVNIGRVFTIIPDIQFLINPALNPSKDFIAVFGLRGRVVI